MSPKKSDLSKKYIFPTLSKYKSLAELIEDPTPEVSINTILDQRSSAETIESIAGIKRRLFIIAEPGYGKSELLKQVHKSKKTRKEKCKLIQLGEIKNPKKDLNIFSDSCQAYYFDALDEVRYEIYNAMVNQLKKFSKEHPETSVLISCRRHDAENNRLKFEQFKDFEYIRINAFNAHNVKSYLQSRDVSDEYIRMLMNSLQSYTRSTEIIKVPRYLEAIVGLIYQGVLDEDNLKKWKRPDYFERFIYTNLENAYKVKIKSKKIRKKQKEPKYNEKEITKRVLEKLALLMEVYQVNSISKDEFISILDGLDSNINLVFLNVCDIDTFFERVMLAPEIKDGIQHIEFHNKEFRQYLAAKELRRIASNPQAVFDLVVDKQFGNINTNWYSVLKFLLEMEPEFILPLTDFLNQRKERKVDSVYWELLVIISPNELKSKTKAKVFKDVFMYLLDHTKDFSSRVPFDIATFYEKENYPLLKFDETTTDEEELRKAKLKIHVLRQAIIKGDLIDNERKEWIKILSEFVKNTKYPVLQQSAIRTIACFGEIKLLEKFDKVFASFTINTKAVFAQACTSIKPNYKFSVTKLIAVLKEKGKYAAVQGVEAVTSKSHLKYLLQAFVEDEKLLTNYIVMARTHYYVNGNPLLENIKSVWGSKIKELSIVLFKKLNSTDFRSVDGTEEFAKEIFMMLQAMGELFIAESLKYLQSYDWYNYEQIYAKAISIENVKPFIESYRSSFSKDDITLALFFFKHFSSEDKKEIFDISEEYFHSYFEKWDRDKLKELSAEEQEEENNKRLYQQFQRHLTPEDGKIGLDVFNFFVSYKDILLPRIKKDERKKLIKFIKPILEQTDASKTNVTVEQRGSRGTTHTLNRNVSLYEKYLDTAEALGLKKEIMLSRKHLIAYLPLLFFNNPEELKDRNIIKRLGELSNDEKQYLVDILKNREDDYLRHSPVGFAEIVRFYDIKKAIPLLKDMIEDEKMEARKRKNVFAILCDYSPEKTYCRTQFKKYKDHQNEYLNEIAYIANETLIKEWKDKAAINWRFSEIKKQSTNYPIGQEEVNQNGFGDFYPQHEIHSLHFANPVLSLLGEQYIKHFKDLLTFANKLLNAKTTQYQFIEYLLNIANQFYLNLRESVEGYHVLYDLFTFIDQGIFKDLKPGFKYYRTQLELAYSQKIDKPKSIQYCINLYNEVKAKNYLPIYNSRDLLFLIQQIIDKEIRDFVYHEGFYRVVEYLNRSHAPGGKISSEVVRPNEDYIQKTLSIQLENALLKRGVRKMDIYREVQLLDNKRPDFVIKYGFVKPLVIEIKLLHNSDITNDDDRKAYKNKLVQYMKSQNAEYGIYLIFKVKDVKTHDSHFEKLRKEYADEGGLVIPDFVDCTGNLLEIDA